MSTFCLTRRTENTRDKRDYGDGGMKPRVLSKPTPCWDAEWVGVPEANSNKGTATTNSTNTPDHKPTTTTNPADCPGLNHPTSPLLLQPTVKALFPHKNLDSNWP